MSEAGSMRAYDNDEHLRLPSPGRVPAILTHSALAVNNLQGIISGKEIVEWYLSLFEALSTLGTLGAGFTLAVVIQRKESPTPAGFEATTVTTWAALSSVLFVLTVLVSQGLTQLFKFERKDIADRIDDPFIKLFLALISLLLQGQVLGAFVFLELVLTAYASNVGYAGIAITSILALVCLILWFMQAVMNARPVNRSRILFAKKWFRRNSED